MKTFQVTIRFTRPMLMNNGDQVGIKKPKGSKKQEDEETAYGTPEEQAARTVYWTEDKSSLCIPAINIKAAMIEVSSAYKYQSGRTKKAITEFVAGSVTIEPILVPLNTKKYLIDTRRAVVGKSAILRCRGKIPEGTEVSFTILVEDDFPDREPGIVLKNILEEALRRRGLGDYRPARKGPFGKAIVTVFRELHGK